MQYIGLNEEGRQIILNKGWPNPSLSFHQAYDFVKCMGVEVKPYKYAEVFSATYQYRDPTADAALKQSVSLC